ncbi:MAG TPA: ribonuclease HII [Verrucomicrobiae bacterium]|nr:ribonuclease HII [Verrucomicrobiae bacterium]
MADLLLAGIDEVGRGSLAGPVAVVAASFLMSEEELLRNELRNVLRREPTDSKKLTLLARERGNAFLKGRIAWGLGMASAAEIDEKGIVGATTLAATRALDGLTARPDKVLADAGLFHGYEKEIPTERFVKGDETYLPIMTASIIAKVARDTFMRELSVHHPHYAWEKNVGYGSAAHRAAITAYGLTEYHRRSFLKSYMDDAARP